MYGSHEEAVRSFKRSASLIHRWRMANGVCVALGSTTTASRRPQLKEAYSFYKRPSPSQKIFGAESPYIEALGKRLFSDPNPTGKTRS